MGESEKAGIKDSTIKILPTPSINFFYMLVMNLVLEMMLKSAVQMWRASYYDISEYTDQYSQPGILGV